MRKLLLLVSVSLTAGALPGMANAHGCIKGAAVGAVAGHVAGHHAVAGAALGCAIGHSRAKLKDRKAEQNSAEARGTAAGSTVPDPAH